MSLDIIILLTSLSLNILLGWYNIKLLKKFFFISGILADFYLTIRAFQVFVRSLYSMDSYHGEPMIQELIIRVKEVDNEMEQFRDIFQYELDEELEEELNEVEKETTETDQKPLFYESP